MAGYDKSRIVGLTDEDLDEFLCAICQEVFNNPVVTQCCRQTYCKACIEQWLQTRKTCPNDRTSLELDQLTAAPRFAFNILDKMKIKCDFHENGCQVVTTIGDLSKHLEICEHKPELNCKTCGLVKELDEEHNCIANLVIKNNSNSDELIRLRKENQELIKLTQNMTWNMLHAIKLARNRVETYEVNRSSQGFSRNQMQFLMDECKKAILNFNSFAEITESLYNIVSCSRIFQGPTAWHVISFTNEGGQSMVSATQYFRIRFDTVHIEIVNSK